MQKQITTHKGDTILLIEVPKDAYDFSIDTFRNHISATNPKDKWNDCDWFSERIENIKNLELIGKLSTLNDKDVEPFVENYEQTIGWRLDGDIKKLPKIKMYANYMIKKPTPITFLKDTALESWNSFLQYNDIDLSKEWVLLKIKND